MVAFYDGSQMLTEIADYEFIHQLGEGSHGAVWLARTPKRLGIDAEQVAVKTLAHHATEADFDRLTDELRQYASIPSSDLVPLYDVGQQGSVLFYAGRYFPDGSLAQPARPFARSAVLAALADAARAAHALHEAGLAHRGIKPGNILIDGDRAKLGDLDLTHVLNPGQTVTGMEHLGSIEFLAPELIQGQPASRATDIWALGATMHKVLTGRPIYPDLPDGSLLQALRYLLSQEPTLNESLRDEEQEIIATTLNADPVLRPNTALEFGEAIDAIVDRSVEGEWA